MSHSVAALRVLLFIVALSFLTNAQVSIWSSYYEKSKDAYEAGDFEMAKRFAEFALREARVSLRESNFDGKKRLCDTLTILAVVNSELGTDCESERFAREALQIAEEIYSESDEEYSITLMKTVGPSSEIFTPSTSPSESVSQGLILQILSLRSNKRSHLSEVGLLCFIPVVNRTATICPEFATFPNSDTAFYLLLCQDRAHFGRNQAPRRILFRNRTLRR